MTKGFTILFVIWCGCVFAQPLPMVIVEKNGVYGRVCVEKDTGKLIEFQTGYAELGTLTKNAVSSGHSKNDVVEKYVSLKEWEILEKKWIIDPVEEKKKKEKTEKVKKLEKIKKELGLSEESFNDLKQLLKLEE